LFGHDIRMVRRKIDNRIRVLIENGVTAGHRTMFVVVGEKARDQVSQITSQILIFNLVSTANTSQRISLKIKFKNNLTIFFII